MEENGKKQEKQEAIPADPSAIFGSLSPGQLEGLLSSMRSLPEWKGLIEREAELLGLFEDDGVDLIPDDLSGTHRQSPPRIDPQSSPDVGDKDVRFAQLMSLCHDGWLVSVKRLDPTWCSGWCDDYEMDGEEPLTLRRLEHDWGGNKFKIWVRDDHGRSRGIVTVRINGTPKRHGIPIYAPEDPRSMPPAQQSQDQSVLVAMMTEMMKMNSTLISRLAEGSGKADLPVEQLDMLMDLAERLSGRSQNVEPPTGLGGLQEALAFFKTMADSKNVTPPAPPATAITK